MIEKTRSISSSLCDSVGCMEYCMETVLGKVEIERVKGERFGEGAKVIDRKRKKRGGGKMKGLGALTLQWEQQQLEPRRRRARREKQASWVFLKIRD